MRTTSFAFSLPHHNYVLYFATFHVLARPLPFLHFAVFFQLSWLKLIAPVITFCYDEYIPSLQLGNILTPLVDIPTYTRKKSTANISSLTLTTMMVHHQDEWVSKKCSSPFKDSFPIFLDSTCSCAGHMGLRPHRSCELSFGTKHTNHIIAFFCATFKKNLKLMLLLALWRSFFSNYGNGKCFLCA